MPIRVNTMTDIGRIIVQKACTKRHLKQKSEEKFGGFRKSMYLCNTFLKAPFLKARAFSSAGLEHLPYKQRVGGSNPSTPTSKVPLLNRELRDFLPIAVCVERIIEMTDKSFF